MTTEGHVAAFREVEQLGQRRRKGPVGGRELIYFSVRRNLSILNATS